MTATADLDALPGRLILAGRRRLAHRVGERFKIIRWRFLLGLGQRQPDDIPPARRGHPVGVPGAQVVAVRFDEGRQRSEHGSRVAVHVGQRVERSLPAGWTGTLASGQLTPSVLVLAPRGVTLLTPDRVLATVAHNG
jgi:hypothetical protein